MSTRDVSRIVDGEVVFKRGGRSFTNATLFVRLLDASIADAPSRTVLEQVMQNVNHQGNEGHRIPFALYGEIPSTRARYVVSVHVDVDRDGEVSVGDYVNTESYPVLTFGHPRNVSVTVKEV